MVQFDADARQPSADTKPGPGEVGVIAARCFQGGDGRRLMAYLRAITIERTLGPGADAAHLRHLEGQRQLVQHITALIERGRSGETEGAISTLETE